MENKKLSLILLNQSIYFFLLVENSLTESIKHKNLLTIVSDNEITFEQYNDKTKWSDFNVLIPILFNFYHGVELLMKGAIVLSEGRIISTHKLSDIYQILKEGNDIPPEIISTLSLYLDIEKMDFWHLKDFIIENKITIDDVYEAFRYPINKKLNKVYEYNLSLTGREEDIIENFKNVINRCKKMRTEIVKYYREATE